MSSLINVSFDRRTSLRVFSRIMIIFTFLLVVYLFTDKENFTIFAKRSELLTGKIKFVKCSPEYSTELNKYQDCIPKNCIRYVTDKVISVREAEVLLRMARKLLALGGSSGGASILDLHSGALSKGQHFVNVYKIEEAQKLFTIDDFNVYRSVKEKIKYTLADVFEIDPSKIYLTHPTFFSEITSKEAVTLHDEYWHPHVDKETYKSFHYTTLLYLDDYNIDFEGGRFVFIDEKVNSTIEPRKGRVSILYIYQWC